MALAIWSAVLLFAAGGEAVPSPPPPARPEAAAAPATPGAGATLAVDPATPAVDPAALALVRKMSVRLQRARTFTFRGRASMELPVDGGALATFSGSATVAVRRPDGLSVERSGDLPEFRFAYDGRAMTAFAPGSGRWGRTAAPPTLDAALLAASEQGGLSFPFDAMLMADPFAAITQGATRIARIGPSTVDGKRTDHVLIASPGLRLELWIDPVAALPARAAVVYTDHPLRPHFSVDYLDWQLDRKLPASTFSPARPAGATQVEFRDACSAFR